jgi:enamine deaminase RidA (YjgF/YER057c/UK114 family)
MIPFEIHCHQPSPAGTPEKQARECVSRLASRLAATGRTGRHALALTFFVDAADTAAYRRRRELVPPLVAELLDAAPPPVCVVAQPPEGGRAVALEAAVLDARVPASAVERRECGGTPYTVVSSGEIRQVHSGGLASPESAPRDTAAQATAAFARMASILRREGMDFGDVLRQWNYIEGVLEGGGEERRGYQVFNDVRSIAYGPSRFPAGYPAATGIGQAAGGVILAFIALSAPPDVRIAPLTNPKQVDAHRYSEEVLVGSPLGEKAARASPKFERGKLVASGAEQVVFVSGTAAIQGERSVDPGDVAAQTRTSIENVALLRPGARLVQLRVYVKRPEDVPVVRGICEEAYGSVPSLYVRADVCREELLVEIEGMMVAPATAAGSGLGFQHCGR